MGKGCLGSSVQFRWWSGGMVWGVLEWRLKSMGKACKGWNVDKGCYLGFMEVWLGGYGQLTCSSGLLAGA